MIDLRRASSRALRAASRARAAPTTLSTILRPTDGFSSKNVRRPFADDALDDALDLAVAELGLGLALELRVADLDRDDDRQALAHVLAAEAFLEVLGHALAVGVVLQRARQRRAEADDVRAALGGVDVVDEGERGLGVRVVVLQRHLDRGRVLGAVEVERLRVQRPSCSC
jgi:hypothetical protein